MCELFTGIQQRGGREEDGDWDPPLQPLLCDLIGFIIDIYNIYIYIYIIIL